MAYIGAQPSDLSTPLPIVNTFTGNGTSNNFTLSRTVQGFAPESLEVFVSNVQQQPQVAYTIAGANVVFTEVPGVGEPIYVIFRDYPVAPPLVIPPQSVQTDMLVNEAVTTAKIASAAVTSIKLANTGVSAAIYGNATQIPSFTVGVDGRITQASNITLTLTDVNNVTGNVTISGNVRAQTYQETFANVSIISGNITLNLSNATVFRTVVTGVANVILQNPPPANVGYSFVLQLYQTGSYAIVWPSSIQWPSNTAPMLSTTNGYVDTIAMYTVDGGTNYYATSILSQY